MTRKLRFPETLIFQFQFGDERDIKTFPAWMDREIHRAWTNVRVKQL